MHRPRNVARRFVAAALMLALCGVVSPSAAFGVLQWSRPQIADTSPTVRRPVGLAGIRASSCPSATFCVAMGFHGDAVWTDPVGGTTAWSVSHLGTVSFDRGSVSCPTATFCVAIGNGAAIGNGFGSQALVSTNPTGGPGAWTAFPIGPSGTIEGVSCGSVSLCAAVDAEGNVFTSSDPAAGSAAWTASHIDPAVVHNCDPHEQACQAPLAAINCPSASFCVASDAAGNAIASADPTGGSRTWRMTHVDTKNQPGFGNVFWVSCASARLCFGADLAGNILSSTHPMGAPTAWKIVHVDESKVDCAGCDQTPFRGLSCVSPSFCVAIDAAGNAIESEHPTGGRSAWATTLADKNGLNTISCPFPSLCFAFDELGNVVVGRARTSAQIKAALAADLARTGAVAHITKLLKADGFTSKVNTLAPGHLSIVWTVPIKNDRRRAQQATIAAGSAILRESGQSRIRIKLTTRGRTLLQSAETLAPTATATFRHRHGEVIVVRRTITIQR